MRMFFCFAVVFCLTVVLWFSYVVIILSTQPLTHLVIRCGLHHDVLTDDDRTATSFHFLDSSFLSAFCAHWSALVCQRRHAKLVSRWVGGSYIVSRPKYGRWRVSTSHITAQPVLCFLTLTDQTNIFQDCHQQHDMTSFSCRLPAATHSPTSSLDILVLWYWSSASPQLLWANQHRKCVILQLRHS